MRIATTTLALVLALAMTSATAFADSIILKGKPAITEVKVQKESYLEVSYLEGSRKKTVPADEVLAVIYDNRPPQFRRGAEYFNLGDYVNAISRLQSSLSEEGDRAPWVKEYAGVYLGRSQMASGQFADAVKSFERVLAATPDTRWFTKIHLDLALCHVKAGAVDKALSTLDRMASEAAAKKIPGNLELEAALMRGEALIAGGRNDEAVEVLKDLAQRNVPRGGQDLEKLGPFVRARRLQVEAHIAAGDVALAKSAADEIAAKASGSVIGEAGSRVAKAAILLAEGQDENAWLRAADLLCRVKTENFTAVSELPATCYLLGLVHRKLDGKLARAKELAKGYFRDAMRAHPESREAILAREQLKTM